MKREREICGACGQKRVLAMFDDTKGEGYCAKCRKEIELAQKNAIAKIRRRNNL